MRGRLAAGSSSGCLEADEEEGDRFGKWEEEEVEEEGWASYIVVSSSGTGEKVDCRLVDARRDEEGLRLASLEGGVELRTVREDVVALVLEEDEGSAIDDIWASPAAICGSGDGSAPGIAIS